VVSACHLPGGIRSPSSLWDLLISKKAANSNKVPKNRFNVDAHFHPNPDRPGSFNIPGGYFLEEPPESFDPTFFNMTPVEAMWLDPQQRRTLEACYEALESAGIPLEKVKLDTIIIICDPRSSLLTSTGTWREYRSLGWLVYRRLSTNELQRSRL